MSLKAKLEAIIYAAQTPITAEQLVQLVKAICNCRRRGGRG